MEDFVYTACDGTVITIPADQALEVLKDLKAYCVWLDIEKGDNVLTYGQFMAIMSGSYQAPVLGRLWSLMCRTPELRPRCTICGPLEFRDERDRINPIKDYGYTMCFHSSSQYPGRAYAAVVFPPSVLRSQRSAFLEQDRQGIGPVTREGFKRLMTQLDAATQQDVR